MILRSLKWTLSMYIALSALMFLPFLAVSHALETITADEYKDQALAASQRGHFEQAISYDLEAARFYQEQGKDLERLDALIRLGKHYQAIGQYERSTEYLGKALELARQKQDTPRIASIFGYLGNAHIYTGPMDTAESYLEQGLALAEKEHLSDVAARILDFEGNMLVLDEDYDKAISVYKRGVTHAEEGLHSVLAARLSVHLGVAALRDGTYELSRTSVDIAHEAFSKLSPSHDKAYGLIVVGQTYRQLAVTLPSSAADLQRLAHEALEGAADVAVAIGDHRAASYAYGYLGQMHEEKGRSGKALQSTRRAVFEAQQINARESLYLWEWQTGRLLRNQGDEESAVIAYTNAIDTLQSIRQEMTAECRACGRTGLSFRESVGPIYYELADLLLKQAGSLKDQKKAESYLMRARDTIELLKTAELRDYFEDPCVDAHQSRVTRLDDISPDTAALYVIPLPDRLELLLSFQTGIKRFVSPVGVDELTEETRRFRIALEKRTTWEYETHAQKLYDWLIRPLETELMAHNIQTFIFVPDGALRTIPIAALHDGTQFLVNKYAVVTSPGLTLTDPRPLQRKEIEVLLAGVTEPVQGFPPLVNVDEELKEIKDLYQGEVLENEKFLSSEVENALKENPYTVVHMATHGEFAGKVQETYILTWQDRITMDQLDQIMKLGQYRQNPVELLTLSACQTAAGDDRAALGLAGVAVKAGARSALATLWYVSDEATSELVVEFYRQLQDPSISKSEALRRAQLSLLNTPRYRHPYYWSPFLLIGNWL